MTRTSKNIVKEWNKINTKEYENNPIFPTRKEISDKFKKIRKIVSEKRKERTKEYLLSSSISCQSYLSNEKLEPEERYLWWCIHICSIIVAGFFIWTVASSTLKNPTGTSQVPQGVPLTSIPYPGVALCAMNRLSKKRVTEFARKLIAKGSSFNRSEEAVIDLLGQLGHAIYNIEPLNDEFERLHEMLFPYSLKELIKELTPQCDEMVLRCTWRKELKNCSSLFSLRKTSRGYCCIFNYIHETESEFRNFHKTNKSGLMAVYGQEFGLSLVINPQLEDYLYTRTPNEGFIVMMFHPSDYPDVSSGNCFDEAVAPMVEQYLSLDAIVVTATEAVESLSLNDRGCITKSDKLMYESNNACYLMCKLNSIYSTCGCIPFYLPLSGFDRYCNLREEECLRRWKKSWDNDWASNDQSESSEAKSNVPCSECKPTCSDIRYSVSRYTVPLQPDSLNAQNDSSKLILKKQVVFKDHSVLHIFFTKESFVLLETNVLFLWYDWLSTLGGLCGLVVGCSILSIAEIIYYFVFGGPAKNPKPFEPKEQKLYWQELKK